MSAGGSGWQRLSGQGHGRRRQTVGDSRPQILLTGSRSLQALQQLVELHQATGRETEGAASRADDAHELVVFGGGDVVQTLMGALDEHLAALLDHRAQNRRPEMRVVVHGRRRLRGKMDADASHASAAQHVTNAPHAGQTGRRMMRIEGSEKGGHVGSDFEEDERRGHGVDGA